MKKSATAVAAVVVLGAAAGATVWVRHHNTSTTAPAMVKRTATAKVATQDLAIYSTTTATLGYTTSVTVSSPVAGTVTSLIDTGKPIGPGTVVATVDGAPVVAMIGDIPSYRALSTTSSDGIDIRQLEQNLVRLGFDPTGAITVDNHFDTATANAVTLWENSLGLTGDGKVTQGEIVYVPGELLVDSTSVNVGGAVGSGSALLTGRQTSRDFTISATGFTSPRISNIVAEGTAITTGTVLFKQNGYPVAAIEGDPSTLPALTRTLSASSADGIDVKMLETMLHAGGFDKAAALTIDDHFDTNTGKALAAWWKSLGITADAATVSLPPGSFVVVPGGLYAGKALVADGGATVGNQVVLPLTTASRQITTTAPVGDTTFTLGAHIEVLYPDNTTGTGTIVKVGTVASNASNTPGATPTVPITLDVDKVPTTYDTFVQIPVTLRVVSQEQKGALVVPVSALVALAEGGFAVEVVDSTNADNTVVSHLIPVTAGIYANGFVSITGDQVKDGLTVVVPA
jgi:peptidoglycan hydrolase-like protein with peptidoglycan-binding domain